MIRMILNPYIYLSFTREYVNPAAYKHLAKLAVPSDFSSPSNPSGSFFLSYLNYHDIYLSYNQHF